MSSSQRSELTGQPGKITGPSGEQFDIAGPAAAVQLASAPRIPAEAAEDLLVVKQGEIFMGSRPDGDIEPRRATGEGLYAYDTRFLSELCLTLGDQRPILLSSSAHHGYEAFIHATSPDLHQNDGTIVPQMTINLRRWRLIESRMYEAIDVKNYGSTDASLTLQLSLAADFADIFEIRGMISRRLRGQALVPKKTQQGVIFGYVGEDDLFRQTLVRFSTDPDHVWIEPQRVTVRWDLQVGPREKVRVHLEVVPSVGEDHPLGTTMEAAQERSRRTARSRATEATTIDTDNQTFDGLLHASMRDLCVLETPMDGGRIVTAGIPWYVAPFGRDALITSYETLMLDHSFALNTLLLLASHQADEDDPARDAEPGKILHEIRQGELARARHVPHAPYWGTVDATPLFLLLAATYHRWTGDVGVMSYLRPCLESALSWIDEHGDRDRDGFVEYERRSPGGLENQGWKDSYDSIVHADGRLATGPIALCEVQGYVYVAKLRIAEVFEALGHADRAAELRRQANELREAFDEAFWMAEEGTYALALDGDKNQVDAVASNAGHCLFTGIVPEERAAAVAERLLAPDMFSGWGIRTLSADMRAYNPMSYHNGSVWPHDNALIAAGLKRYGFAAEAMTIVSALFDASTVSREARLPELFCGFRREQQVPYVSYPVACSPQAWAAGAPFMLMQALLGISVNAPQQRLHIHHPTLPDWLTRVEITGMRIGEGEVGLAFERQGDETSFSVLQRTEGIQIALID